MGEKHWAKCSWGKVDRMLTAQHIGKPNYKCLTDDNPYGAEEQFGKHAKPDVCSADANTWACKAAKWEVLKAKPLSPLHLPASQPLPAPHHLPLMLPLPVSQPFCTVPPIYVPTPPLHVPTMYSHYPFQPPLAPLSQPMYSHSQRATSLAPSYYPAFNLSTYTYFHQM